MPGEVKGTQQVIDNLSHYSANVAREIIGACEAVQAKVINEARGVVPVVTGNLQGSIQPGGIEITDENITAVVAATANYASFVEFGTSRQRAQPFLVPALMGNIETFRKAVTAAVKRAKAA